MSIPWLPQARTWLIMDRTEQKRMYPFGIIYHLGPARALFPSLVNPAAHMPLGRQKPSISVSDLVLIYPCISKTPRRAPSSSGSSFNREWILSAFGYGTLRSLNAFRMSKSIVSVVYHHNQIIMQSSYSYRWMLLLAQSKPNWICLHFAMRILAR